MPRALFLFGFVMIALVGIVAPAQGGEQDFPPPDPLLSLIPRDGELEGWVCDGTPALCYDEASLSEYIDGAAPYYLEHGAVGVLFQYYLHPATAGEIKIEIYQMRDNESARRLFQEIGKGKPASEEEGTRRLGEARHLEQALLGIWNLEFYEGPFFVRMESRGARRAVIEFGLRVCHSIRGWEPKAR